MARLVLISTIFALFFAAAQVNAAACAGGARGAQVEDAAPPQQGAEIQWDTLLSFLAGAASAITAGLAVEYVKARRQKALNRERVLGLLRLVCLQARSAVDHGETLDLSPIQTIYQAEGLYQALLQAGLAGPAERVWSQGAEHNRFAGRRQGWEHENDLASAVNALDAKLNEQTAQEGSKRRRNH